MHVQPKKTLHRRAPSAQPPEREERLRAAAHARDSTAEAITSSGWVAMVKDELSYKALNEAAKRDLSRVASPLPTALR